MFPLRLITSTARGVSSLTTSQFGSSIGPQPFPLVATAYDTQENVSRTHLAANSTTTQRQLTTSIIHCRPSRMTKAKGAEEMDINLPEKPKKPVTPWIMFLRERKGEIISQHGSKMNAADISVVLAKEWQRTDKTRYEREYQRLHDEYASAVEMYEQSLTDEHRDHLQMAKDSKRDSKGLKQLRKTHPPILPRNSANLYLQERSKQHDYKEMIKSQKIGQVSSDIFKEYRSLSDAEKKKYLDMQEEDKSRFQHEFLVWYEGVQSNANLSRAAREQANAMRDRLKTLGYI